MYMVGPCAALESAADVGGAALISAPPFTPPLSPLSPPPRLSCICQVFLVNAPYFFTGLWASVKPFLDPRIVNSISISSQGRRELIEYIGAENVPAEYGGSDPTPLGQAPEELK